MTTKGQELDTLKPPHSWPKPVWFLWSAHTRCAHIRQEPRTLSREGLSRALCGLAFYRESTQPVGVDGLCSTCVRYAQTKFGWVLETQRKSR